MTYPRRPRPSYRGTVLIVVLMLLAVLALLVVTYATNTVLERDVARNYIDQVRARLVAKAGIEHAVARIQSLVQRGRFDDPSLVYWGSNTLEVGQPDQDTPLFTALNPSFAVEDESAQDPDDERRVPMKFRLDEREIGISGAMNASAYGLQSDVYRLRVIDCSTRINVNDGIDDPAVAKNLRRILNHLGNAVKVSEAGARLMDRRPVKGYRSRSEVQDVLGAADFSKLAQHITLYSWADPNLVNPVPLSRSTLGAYPVDYNEKLSLYRYGRSRSSAGAVIESDLLFAPDYAQGNGFDHALVALDEVNAQWISRSSRSPVNVNGASLEVLTALIADLKGFFMAERRKRNPGSQDPYSFLAYPKLSNRPGMDPQGCEIGFLYATPAFVGPTDDKSTVSRGAGGISAKLIAEELVACRSRSKSKVGSFDYADAWFGGPFRSWRQFNAFCDSLVAREILVDTRPVYFDYSPANSGSTWGSDALVQSQCQPLVAAQALADVLKANFNPNCALNELNPDRNLFLEVDKTDLICNSTEFCFAPMGVFEIESEGVIVKPAGSGDLMKSRTGLIQARETLECVVRIYDVLRETTQSDFSKGELGAGVRGLLTNSNKPLEIGPEPDAGENPEECRWSGWLQLSTLGGVRRPPGKKLLATTPKSEAEQGASVVAHYQFDHRLNYHGSDQVNPLQFSGLSANQPDRTESQSGPYGPTRGRRGQYRLARDWDPGHPPADAQHRAVSDLRIDGAYIERDSALLYPCTSQIFDNTGTVSMWLKPSYKPEMTGKTRTYFSTDCTGTFPNWAGVQTLYQLINGIWFFPAHSTAPYEKSWDEFNAQKPWYPIFEGPPPMDRPYWRPISICVGYATPGIYGGACAQMSPTLNHNLHKGCEGLQSPLKHHEWIHVAYLWKMSTTPEDQVNTHVTMMINGVPVTESPSEIWLHPAPTKPEDWTDADAVFRLGEPSSTMSYGGSRNWAADATVDEFYLWKGDALGKVATMFDRGRYHNPRRGKEGLFTSQPLLADKIVGQKMAPATTALAPTPTGPETERRRTSGSGTMATAAVPPEQIRPLCAFWTWYPELHDFRGRPMVRDRREEDGLMEAEVKLQLLVDDQEVTEYLADEGGSPIVNVGVRKGQKLQYRLQMSIPTSHGASILMATPFIDDVTIFYMRGAEYIQFNRVDIVQ